MFCSQDICIFVLLAILQIWKSTTTIQTLMYIGSYTFNYFFRILCSVKMTFSQILVLTLSSNVKNGNYLQPFYDFHKLTTQQLLLIFSWWRSLFLIVSVNSFKRVNNLKLIIFAIWLIVVCWRIKKVLDLKLLPIIHISICELSWPTNLLSGNVLYLLY